MGILQYFKKYSGLKALLLILYFYFILYASLATFSSFGNVIGGIKTKNNGYNNTILSDEGTEKLQANRQGCIQEVCRTNLPNFDKTLKVHANTLISKTVQV